ncbi:MAG TPA: nucleotidyltransferase domain-containing protein [Coriobacteriia bacterium]
MTKHSPTRMVPIGDHVDLATLLALAESGTTTLFTREGVPVVAVGPAPGEALIARESTTVYAAGPTIDTPQPATALMRLIGGVAARSVLRIFLNEPDRPIHQREVARRAGLGLRSAQLALGRLESLGIIVSTRDGNRRYYRANRTRQFEDLRGLMGRELGIAGVVARALDGLADRIDRAFIFGSLAAGTDTLGSDIDLVVVGSVTQDALVVPLAAAQRELGREIDVAVYRSEDFARKHAEGNHFITAVLAGPHIDLIGGPDDA